MTVNDSCCFKALFSKISDYPKLKTGCFKIIQNLAFMYVCNL